jgi:hypothetical protein
MPRNTPTIPARCRLARRTQLRLDKDKMKLRVEDMDDKERDYMVVSMTPRQERTETAERK